MTAAALPFLRRGVGCGRAGDPGSRSDIFCRFVRRIDGGLEGSGSGIGLGSRVLRFLDDDDGAGCAARVGGAVANGVAAGVSEALAACRADERVVLEDMSICYFDNYYAS